MIKIGAIPRIKKSHIITLRLTLRDIMLLNKCAAFLEMDRSDLLRMYIRKNNAYYGRMILNPNKPLGYDTDFFNNLEPTNKDHNK
jgi:hypothetical protein